MAVVRCWPCVVGRVLLVVGCWSLFVLFVCAWLLFVVFFVVCCSLWFVGDCSPLVVCCCSVLVCCCCVLLVGGLLFVAYCLLLCVC